MDSTSSASVSRATFSANQHSARPNPYGTSSGSARSIRPHRPPQEFELQDVQTHGTVLQQFTNFVDTIKRSPFASRLTHQQIQLYDLIQLGFGVYVIQCTDEDFNGELAVLPNFHLQDPQGAQTYFCAKFSEYLRLPGILFHTQEVTIEGTGDGAIDNSIIITHLFIITYGFGRKKGNGIGCNLNWGEYFFGTKGVEPLPKLSGWEPRKEKEYKLQERGHHSKYDDFNYTCPAYEFCRPASEVFVNYPEWTIPEWNDPNGYYSVKFDHIPSDEILRKLTARSELYNLFSRALFKKHMQILGIRTTTGPVRSLTMLPQPSEQPPQILFPEMLPQSSQPPLLALSEDNVIETFASIVGYNPQPSEQAALLAFSEDNAVEALVSLSGHNPQPSEQPPLLAFSEDNAVEVLASFSGHNPQPTASTAVAPVYHPIPAFPNASSDLSFSAPHPVGQSARPPLNPVEFFQANAFDAPSETLAPATGLQADPMQRITAYISSRKNDSPESVTCVFAFLNKLINRLVEFTYVNARSPEGDVLRIILIHDISGRQHIVDIKDRTNYGTLMPSDVVNLASNAEFAFILNDAAIEQLDQDLLLKDCWDSLQVTPLTESYTLNRMLPDALWNQPVNPHYPPISLQDAHENKLPFNNISTNLIKKLSHIPLDLGFQTLLKTAKELNCLIFKIDNNPNYVGLLLPYRFNPSNKKILFKKRFTYFFTRPGAVDYGELQTDIRVFLKDRVSSETHAFIFHPYWGQKLLDLPHDDASFPTFSILTEDQYQINQINREAARQKRKEPDS